MTTTPGSSVPIGTPTKPCRLCGRTNLPLRVSHYVPAALYKMTMRPGSAPVIVSATTAISTSKQTADELLCDECEGRFNKGGEDWVLSKCWKDEKTFPLRDDLLATGPVSSRDDFAVFEAASIPAVLPDKLAYFAASVFWRGATHSWTVLRQRTDRLPFGPFEEAIRLYLMGGNWPGDVALQVYVANAMDEFRNATSVFPYLFLREEKFRMYCFTIPGLTFYLFIGQRMPESILRYCTASSPERCIFMSDAVDLANSQRAIKVFKTTKRVGALARRSIDPSTALSSPWPAEEVLQLLRERGTGT